jgi:uncharacterized protein GlcG (DUF336 family)
MDSTGDFVIAWQSNGQDGDGNGVFAQRYNAAGATQGGEFQVNTYTTSDQTNPAVAMDATGDFVIAWQSNGQDGDGSGIYAQRYGSGGATLAGEFQVNTYATSDQSNPAAAMDSSGAFVIAWQSTGEDGDGFGVYAQLYHASGATQGSEFQVDTDTIGNQQLPSVAMDSSGDFAIAWQSFGEDGDGDGIYAQRYNASGMAQASEFKVNTYTTSDQVTPSLAMDSTGDFIAAWASDGQDGSDFGVFAQQYDQYFVTETGSPGDETLVITKPAGGSANLLMTSTALGVVTISDPNGFFIGGPLSGVTFNTNSLVLGPAAAGVVHFQFDFSANDSHANNITIGNLNGATMPGFDVMSQSGAAGDTVTLSTGALNTGSSTAADAGIHLTNVGQVVVATTTTITTAQLSTDHPAAVDFGGANISAAAAGVNLAIDTSSNTPGISGGNVTVEGLSNSGGQYINNLTITTTGGANAAAGSISLANQIETAGTQTYSGPVELIGLHGAATLNSIGAGANVAITFGSTVDGASSLMVESDGRITFGGVVGGGVSLDALTTKGNSLPAGGVTRINANVTTSGTQTYDNAVLLANDPRLTSSNGTITFNWTVGGNSALTTSSAGTTTFNALVSIASLTTGGGAVTIINAGTVSTVGPQTYNVPLIVTSNPALTSSQSSITFNSTVGGNSALTTSSTGATTFNALVNIASLTTVADGMTTFRNGPVTTTADQTYNSPLMLIGNLIFTSNAGSLTFGSTVGGNSALTAISHGATMFDALVSIASLQAGKGGITKINTGTVTTVGPQTYSSPVLLSNNPVLTSSRDNITFQSTVGGNSALTTNSPGTTIFDALVSIASLTVRGKMANPNGSPIVTVNRQAAADPPADPPGDPMELSMSDVQTLLDRASAAAANNSAIIAVVDQGGDILGVKVENGVPIAANSTSTLVFAIDGALAEARTAAFFSSNQQPLPSRTVQYISQSTITQREVDSSPEATDPTLNGPGLVAPIEVGGQFPPGVQNTPNVDLFEIELSNRDSTFVTDPTSPTGYDTLNGRFNADPVAGINAPVSYGVQSNRVPYAQSRGIGTLPGGEPIYLNGNLVGGLGVFFPGPNGYASYEQGFAPGQTTSQRTSAPLELLAEWMAFAAVGGSAGVGAAVGAINGVPTIPGLGIPDSPSATIYLAGIALPTFGPIAGPLGLQQLLAVGQSAGAGNPAKAVYEPINAAGNVWFAPGVDLPDGWLVPAKASPVDNISAADVTTIINDGIAAANQVRAQIRPLGNSAKMTFAVSDSQGNILGLYRMPDATYFSTDVAVAKARNDAYYNSGNLMSADQVKDSSGQAVPLETAFTSRTYRFLAEPRYPAGITGTRPPPFSILNDPGVDLSEILDPQPGDLYANGEQVGAPVPASAFSQSTTSVLGYEAFHPYANFRDSMNPMNQNGVVFFPGSSGLYKNSVLMGGIGVSGDGVDQDDVVTASAAAAYAAPANIQADQYFVNGVRLPYQSYDRNALEL